LRHTGDASRLRPAQVLDIVGRLRTEVEHVRDETFTAINANLREHLIKYPAAGADEGTAGLFLFLSPGFADKSYIHTKSP
jgi:hypothetical protein